MYEGVQVPSVPLSMHQDQEDSSATKAPYIPPKIKVFLIKIENSLTSASVRVSNSSTIREDWGAEENDERTINWD